MKILLYIAGNEQSLQAVMHKLVELPAGEYVVTVKKNRAIRSLSANKYYHAILNILGSETGHSHEQLHEICKQKFNTDVIKFPKGGIEFVGKSTADLDTKEFAEYINRVKMWAQDEFGVIIPEARDIDYKRWMEIENAYNQVHSGY